MSTITSVTRNRNPGIVPPWLLPNPNRKPHTWAELEAMLNNQGFTEVTTGHSINPNETENEA